MTGDQLEEHLSNYLLNSWSYSKVSCFARNEKDFEKTYVYGERGRSSATSIAGSAYHTALEYFFNTLQDSGRVASLPELEQIAFSYIEEISDNEWKLQKTTPTVEQCIQKALKDVTTYIGNFYKEKELYLADIDVVLGVEMRFEEWLVVNGVDIPLPCHAVADLIVRLKSGKVAIIDHKSKSAYSDEKEVALVHGKQAITYVLCLESCHSSIQVSEVWFVENKASTNKDGSPQLRKHIIEIDEDSRRLYEAMLYEPLRRMLEAIANPDYVYTINDSDNLVDKAELYDFWCKTMIAEVDDFSVPSNKKEQIAQRLRKIKDASLAMIDAKVITKFKKEAASFISYDLSMTNMTNSEKIHHTLMTFGMNTQVIEISGFSSDTYLVDVAAGVKVSNIYKYKKDIANALNVPNVRIPEDLAIYDGKSYLAIEVSKKRTETLNWDTSYLREHKIPVGLDNFRNTIIWDMDNHSTPHILVCGATGSGKSVELRSIIEYAIASGVKDIVVMDPKYEFCDMQSSSVRVYNEVEDIAQAMSEMVADMQTRPKTGDRHLTMLIVDEFADIIDSAKDGDSVEKLLKMITQKGRSLGFRVVAATQRASVKIITGDTKVNFPVQICFRMPKAVDSKVVIDEEGAECLQGQGDGLIKSPEYMDRVVRFQGFYRSL